MFPENEYLFELVMEHSVSVPSLGFNGECCFK
jgi:hypothetical protein